MFIPTKAPWFLFSTLVVLLLIVTAPATSKDARRSEPNVDHATSRSVPTMTTNIKDFLKSELVRVQAQRYKNQYLALWQFNTPINQVDVKKWVYSPPLSIAAGSTFSPPVSSANQNWVTVTTKRENRRIIHTEETLQRLLEGGTMKLDGNGKSFLLHSYFSVCEKCAPRVCTIFEDLKQNNPNVTEGLVTFEQMYTTGYQTSINTLKGCGLDMLQYTAS